MPPVKTHTPEMATRLIDEAGRLLTEEGAAAVTLRRVASRSRTSTTAVYTLFGDKQGLLTAMYRAGFERLGEALRAAAAAHADPLAALGATGMAYRAAALANPHLYDLMFGHPVPAFEPDAEADRAAEAAYQPVHEAVERCIAAGVMYPGVPEVFAEYLWAMCHGLVSLELAGHLAGTPEEREERYRDALVRSSSALLV